MSYFLRLKGPVLDVDFLVSLFHGIDDPLVGTFLEKIELTAEYAGEYLLREQSDPDYTRISTAVI